MSIIKSLFQNHINKDLDNNFVESLKAILFLTPPKKEDFEDLISLHVSDIKDKSDHSYKNLSDQFFTDTDENEEEYSVASHFTYKKNNSSKVVYYNLGDFLIYKLLENLRRLYAANKVSSNNKTSGYQNNYNKNLPGYFNNLKANQSVDLNNKKQLIETQNVIYQIADILKEYLYFSDKEQIYQKAILGKDIKIKPIELLAYINCHEHLSDDSKIKNFNLLKQHISNHKMSDSFINHCSGLIFKEKDRDTIQLILNHTDDNLLFKSLNVSNGYRYGWFSLTIDHLISKDTAHTFSTENKLALLHVVSSSDLLDNDFFHKFISNPEEFTQKFKSLFVDEKIKEAINKDALKYLNPIFLGIKKSTDVVYELITSLNSAYFLNKVIYDDNYKENQKQMIYNLYDFNNPELLKNCISYINHNNKNNMKGFLNIGNISSNKEAISFILSLDSSYIEICKAAYLNIKLNETVKNSESLQEKKSPRTKI